MPERNKQCEVQEEDQSRPRLPERKRRREDWIGAQEQHHQQEKIEREKAEIGPVVREHRERRVEKCLVTGMYEGQRLVAGGDQCALHLLLASKVVEAGRLGANEIPGGVEVAEIKFGRHLL